MMLVDSEGPVGEMLDVWRHLGQSGWTRPADAADDGAHLMVECMEAWFLADKQALVAQFGRSFNTNALPANQHVEANPEVRCSRRAWQCDSKRRA